MAVPTSSDFKDLYISVFDKLCNYAAARVGDAEIAYDIVQDSFVRLWERYRRRDPSTWRPLIYTIVRNKCLDHLRIRKSTTTLEESWGAPDNTDSLALYNEYLLMLETSLSALPSECASTFRMKRLDGLTEKEIAAHEGVSAKAIEKRLAKATKHLRKTFGKI